MEPLNPPIFTVHASGHGLVAYQFDSFETDPKTGEEIIHGKLITNTPLVGSDGSVHRHMFTVGTGWFTKRHLLAGRKIVATEAEAIALVDRFNADNAHLIAGYNNAVVQASSTLERITRAGQAVTR